MENKFKESIYIEQIMVVGENQKFPGALIVPSWDNLKKWADENGVQFSDYASLATHPKVLELYNNEIAEGNKEFGNWEQIKKFEIVPGEWTIDGGEMTPTLKLKRKPIAEKYASLIQKIYTE